MTNQKIFFSYSRADGSAFALRLAVDLKKKGFDVWIDQEDIKAGLEWDTEIAKALESCYCVLFVETEKSVVSDTCLDEVSYALEHNKKVIPLIYVDSRTPFRLSRLQHINFTTNYETALAMLVHELEGNAQAVAYPPEKSPHILKLPFYTKNYKSLIVVTCLAVLIAAIVLITSKNKSAASAETKRPISLSDTTIKKPGELATEPNAQMNPTEEEVDIESNEIAVPIENKSKHQGKKASVNIANVNKKSAEPTGEKTARILSNLNEVVAGNWILTDVEPKARLQSGYLKIEALGENKATIKSYIQFYYPYSKASSYLTVFDAFAGCTSCAVKKEMKLAAEDIAVSSRTVKKLQEDQADGRKAGDVILDANYNKSVRGTVTLQFVDNNNAVIKVKQPLSIPLANELNLEPFVYTFRFKKND